MNKDIKVFSGNYLNNKSAATFFLLLLLPLAMAAIFLANLTVQEENGIYGKVRSNSASEEQASGISGAIISALDASGQVVASVAASAEGNYRLIVAAGLYRLKAEHPGYLGFDTREAIIQVLENHFTLFNIGMSGSAAPRAGEIRGIVLSEDNIPMSAAVVKLSDAVGNELYRTETNAEGSFLISLAAGTYVLVVEHPEANTLGPLTIEVGQENPVELTLTMTGESQPPARLQGLIRARAEGGAPGRPVAGAVISAINEETGKTDTTTSNDIGYYRFSLPAGAYKLSASHPDFESISSGDEAITAEPDSVNTWNALVLPKSPQSGVRTCRERFPLTIGSSYGERHSIFQRIAIQGLLTISYRWSGDAGKLALIIRGPDGVPRRVDGRSPLSITTEVTSEIIALGMQWEINIANFGGGSGQGTLIVNYPCEN